MPSLTNSTGPWTSPSFEILMQRDLANIKRNIKHLLAKINTRLSALDRVNKRLDALERVNQRLNSMHSNATMRRLYNYGTINLTAEKPLHRTLLNRAKNLRTRLR